MQDNDNRGYDPRFVEVMGHFLTIENFFEKTNALGWNNLPVTDDRRKIFEAAKQTRLHVMDFLGDCAEAGDGHR